LFAAPWEPAAVGLLAHLTGARGRAERPRGRRDGRTPGGPEEAGARR
jgi:hypothetical protein